MPTETKYEQLYEQRHTGITRVVGPITPAVIDKLWDEVATIAATTKTYSYQQGQVFGLVAAIIPEAKYQVLINDNTFTHTSVADPGAYDQAALALGASAAQREQIVAEHKRQQTDYKNYIAVQQVSKQFVITKLILIWTAYHLGRSELLIAVVVCFSLIVVGGVEVKRRDAGVLCGYFNFEFSLVLWYLVMVCTKWEKLVTILSYNNMWKHLSQCFAMFVLFVWCLALEVRRNDQKSVVCLPNNFHNNVRYPLHWPRHPHLLLWIQGQQQQQHENDENDITARNRINASLEYCLWLWQRRRRRGWSQGLWSLLYPPSIPRRLTRWWWRRDIICSDVDIK